MSSSSTSKIDAKTTNPPKQGPYSDTSSSYWPHGWNFERFSRADATDRAELGEEELLKIQAGLRDVLGVDGVGQMSLYLWELEKKRIAETHGKTLIQLTRESNLPSPNWLQHCQKYHRDQPWGFVVFQTASYDDPSRSTRFKSEVTRIIEIPFRYEEQYDSTPPGFKQARDKFELHWVTDPTLAGATRQQLLDKYQDLRRTVPTGLSGKLFLCASESAISSILASNEAEIPTTTSSSKRWQSTAPFLLAVVADKPSLEPDHDEWTFYKPVFKAGVETLIDELWWIADSDIMGIQRVTRNVKGSHELGSAGGGPDAQLDEIWWSTSPSPERLRRRRIWSS